jgi:hypothetical protein
LTWSFIEQVTVYSLGLRSSDLTERAVHAPWPPLWRTITLHGDREKVQARVSDNVHEFGITLLHDGTQVTGITAEAVRIPWVTCPAGITQLKLLVGSSLVETGRAKVDQTRQCTHMLDLAKLAMAHGLRGGDRIYKIKIYEDPDATIWSAVLARDDEDLLRWRVVNDIVVSPGPFFEHVTTGPAVWASEIDANADLREAALVLRRALLVFRGRRLVTAATYRADSVPELAGLCVSFQPELVRDAVRPADFKEFKAPPGHE